MSDAPGLSYLKIPGTAIRGIKKLYAREVYAYLILRQHNVDWIRGVALNTISKRLNIPLPTVRKAIRILASKPLQYIVVERSTERANNGRIYRKNNFKVIGPMS
jgi:hypothetical protein